MIHCLVALGTRPEAIKLSPVIRALRDSSGTFRVTVCNTGQHRDMVRGVISLFGLEIDRDLNVMSANQRPVEVMQAVIGASDPLLKHFRPDLVLVQGDTTTALAMALACSYAAVPVGHVEAGLRTYDLSNPFPEEINRQIIGRIARWHFAPTSVAKANLLSEGVNASSIWVTGNTGVDALLQTSKRWPSVLTRDLIQRLRSETWSRPHAFDDGFDPEALVLITMHRRESFGPAMEEALKAVGKLAGSHPNVQFVFPVHPNPQVRRAVFEILQGIETALPNLALTDPLDYETFVRAMKAADLILTDSGGIQEEGPTLGVPVLVLRDKTEREEALDDDLVRLVGTQSDRITVAASEILSSPRRDQDSRRPSLVFGDGLAAARISKILAAPPSIT